MISLAGVKLPLSFVFPPKAGSPRHAGSPCVSHRLLRGGSRRNSENETMCATPDFTLVFHPPELPEDTLMEVLGIKKKSRLYSTHELSHPNRRSVSVVSVNSGPTQTV